MFTNIKRYDTAFCENKSHKSMYKRTLIFVKILRAYIPIDL